MPAYQNRPRDWKRGAAAMVNGYWGSWERAQGLCQKLGQLPLANLWISGTYTTQSLKRWKFSVLFVVLLFALLPHHGILNSTRLSPTSSSLFISKMSKRVPLLVDCSIIHVPFQKSLRLLVPCCVVLLWETHTEVCWFLIKGKRAFPISLLKLIDLLCSL